MSKLGWCLATVATLPLFGETCETLKGNKLTDGDDSLSEYTSTPT